MRYFIFGCLFVSPFLWSTAALAAGSDGDANCANWAEMGECDNNPNFMLATCATSCEKVKQQDAEDAKELSGISSFFDLEAKDIRGRTIKFEQFRGKVTIIVNVASYCGYTESHYRGLVELWDDVKDKDVEILAFPCNQFGQQEPESNSKIEQFAQQKGAQFRMMDKVNVNGPNASLVYKYLKKQAGPKAISWNFGKSIYLFGIYFIHILGRSSFAFCHFSYYFDFTFFTF